jgi:hypothetical protein
MFSSPQTDPRRRRMGGRWTAIVSGTASVLLAITATGAPPTFAPGDIVMSTPKELVLYRAGQRLAAWGERQRICAGKAGRLWGGTAATGRVVLRQYQSPTDVQEWTSPPLGDQLVLAKLLRRGQWIFAVYTIPHEEAPAGPWVEGVAGKERLAGRWVHVLPFDSAAERFGAPIPLRDLFGRAEMVVRHKKLVSGAPLPKGVRPNVLYLGLWDAALTPDGTLWLSTQTRLTSYRIGSLPQGLTTILNPARIEGYGQRSKKLDGIVGNYGNNTGICALNDRDLAVVNGNPPGGLTVVNTDSPGLSRPLSRSIFATEKQAWGLAPVLALPEQILVAHRHPQVARIYRVSRATGESLGTYAEGVIATEMVLIQK